MLYSKKKDLLKSEMESRYDIVKEDSELPIFVDKKRGSYFQTETKNEFYDCLMSTKISYFKLPNFVNELCVRFSYLQSYTKREKKLFDKSCEIIIKRKLKTFEQEL